MGRATVAPVCAVKTGPDFAREVPESTRYVGEKVWPLTPAPIRKLRSENIFYRCTDTPQRRRRRRSALRSLAAHVLRHHRPHLHAHAHILAAEVAGRGSRAVVALAGCVQLPWRHLNHVHACPCPAGARRERATAPAAAHTAWRRYTRRSRTVQTRRACPLDHASQKRTAMLVREGASLVWGSSHLGLDPRFVSTPTPQI